MNEHIMNNTTVEHRVKVVTWSVIAGVAVALSSEITLNFLGMGLGLASIDLSASSLFKAGVGSVIWLTVSGILSMALGGWIAGKVSDCTCGKVRILHGLLAWCFATLLTVLVSTTTAGVMIGGSTNIVKSSINMVGKKSIPATAQYAVNSPDETKEANPNTLNTKTADEATDNLGAASIAMFVAFLLSALASMAGAFWANPWSKRNIIRV